MATDRLTGRLGFPALIALGAAGVIGTSWIYTNGVFFAKYGAGGEIFGLVIGVILAGCVSLAYAELAGTLPRAGGEVVYGYIGFNRTMGFCAGWLLIGAYVSSLAFYVGVTGSLLENLFPFLHTMPIYALAGTTVYLPSLAVGIVLALIIFALNIRGADLGASIQIILFLAMILIGAALVVTAFTHGSPRNFWPPFGAEQSAIPSTIAFVLPAMTFMTGFSLVATLAEDAKVSPQAIGRAVLGTVVCAGLFYIIVLLGSAWIIPWEQTAKLERGTIDAFRIAGFPLLSSGAYAIALLGLLTSFLALFLSTSRIILAMARAGLLPRVFGRIDSRHGTPVHALTLTLILAILLGLMGRAAIVWFLDTGGLYIGLAWLIAVASLYRIRKRYPNAPRHYVVRLNFLPIIGAIAAVLVIVLTVIPGTNMSLQWPFEYLMVAAWVVIGVILYVLTNGRTAVNDTDARKSLLGPLYDTFR